MRLRDVFNASPHSLATVFFSKVKENTCHALILREREYLWLKEIYLSSKTKCVESSLFHECNYVSTKLVKYKLRKSDVYVPTLTWPCGQGDGGWEEKTNCWEQWTDALSILHLGMNQQMILWVSCESPKMLKFEDFWWSHLRCVLQIPCHKMLPWPSSSYFKEPMILLSFSRN